MAPVSQSLRTAFIVVDVILGILGTLWLLMSIFSHGIHHGEPESDVILGIKVFSVMYVVGISIMAMSALGLYGIRKEKQWALILFCVILSMVSIMFLVIVVSGALISSVMKTFVSLDELPLSTQNEDLLSLFDAFQKEFDCCGFRNGTTDWIDGIPESCRCPIPPKSDMHCTPLKTEEGEIMMHEEPCYPHFVELMMIFNAWTGTSFVYLMSMIIGVTLGSVVVHRMRKTTISPPVTFTTHSSDSKYTELLA